MSNDQLKTIVLTILWVQEKNRLGSMAEFPVFLQKTEKEVGDLMEISKEVLKTKGWGSK